MDKQIKKREIYVKEGKKPFLKRFRFFFSTRPNRFEFERSGRRTKKNVTYHLHGPLPLHRITLYHP